MKLMHCPLNGDRNISEFVCGGEVRHEPASDCSNAEWADYVFMENNTAGVVHEWWVHTPTSYWFIATRNTLTEEILVTATVADFFASNTKNSRQRVSK